MQFKDKDKESFLYLNNKKYFLLFKYRKDSLLFNLIDYILTNNIVIPRFCYHSQLAIAGNCRMCLVENTEMIKPIVSCATILKENLKIFTNSNLVKKAREYILEFLLINHPLDCPICDQGGECDLQDQTLLFGSDKGRFYELKKITINKECSFFVKLIMTRCIHCTRCIRFLKDLNNNHELGMLGRGSHMEIGNYINSNINNEFVSNIADLCPVGALTLKFSEFKNRVWELVSFKFFDILDSTASTLNFFLSGEKIVRVLPYNNKFINNQWITDRSRYLFDSFYNNRLDHVYSFSKKKKNF